VRWVYKPEVTWGETPVAGTYTEIRTTGADFNHVMTTAASAEVRSDRQVPDLVEIGGSAVGSLPFELSETEYDPFMAAILGTTFTVTTMTAANLQAIAASSTIVRATGSFLTDGFVVGQWVKTTGFTAAANNGIFLITALTATIMTVFPTATLVDEVSTAGRSISGKFARNGTTPVSYVFEEQDLDLNIYNFFNGMRVSQMDLSFATQAILTGTFALMGKGGSVSGASPLGTTVTPAQTGSVMNATANVGTIYEGTIVPPSTVPAVLTTALKSVALTVTGNLRNQPAIANKSGVGIGYGSLGITGTLVAYFDSITLRNKFFSHVVSGLSLRVTSVTPKTYIFTLPKLYFSDGNKQQVTINNDLLISLPFTAVREPTQNFTMQIDIL